MLTRQSVLHVNQGVGTCYSKTIVTGYYNDLTEKVTQDNPDILIPKYFVDTGEEIYIACGIFQYGLGAYDLYLNTGEETYKKKLLACAKWAVEHQQKDGGWVAVPFGKFKSPYSSMAQGEGISLLIRAYIVTQDEQILNAVHKAKEFLLKPVIEGGTAEYCDGDVYLYEYPQEPLVLNGWIFSVWGLYDYCKYFDAAEDKKVLETTLNSLKKKLQNFDNQYWSTYDEGKRLASPFYHKLHIAQLTVMHDLFGDLIYKEYAHKWQGYQKKIWNSRRAFIAKALQKIFE